MPAGSTGWFWHCLARETGRIGHLYSPDGQRGPWPWLPYALDNGCFSLWDQKRNRFDRRRWVRHGRAAWEALLTWADAAPIAPLWSVVPDRPGDWEETKRMWDEHAGHPFFGSCPRAIAVQDGAGVEDVRALRPRPEVIAVGGTTAWKWETVPVWARSFPRVHVLRCNSPRRLYELEAIGVESCDGTGWYRGDFRLTAGLEEWARRKAVATTEALWRHAVRGRRAHSQEEGAAALPRAEAEALAA